MKSGTRDRGIDSRGRSLGMACVLALACVACSSFGLEEQYAAPSLSGGEVVVSLGAAPAGARNGAEQTPVEGYNWGWASSLAVKSDGTIFVGYNNGRLMRVKNGETTHLATYHGIRGLSIRPGTDQLYVSTHDCRDANPALLGAIQVIDNASTTGGTSGRTLVSQMPACDRAGGWHAVNGHAWSGDQLYVGIGLGNNAGPGLGNRFEGTVTRVDLGCGGGSIEQCGTIIARGLRNPYDLAASGGFIYASDNDAEIGGRKTAELLYKIPVSGGADFGFPQCKHFAEGQAAGSTVTSEGCAGKTQPYAVLGHTEAPTGVVARDNIVIAALAAPQHLRAFNRAMGDATVSAPVTRAANPGAYLVALDNVGNCIYALDKDGTVRRWTLSTGGSPTPPAAEEACVAATIVDEDGRTMPNAVVEVIQQGQTFDATSGADGTATVRGIEPDVEIDTIRVGADGYPSVTWTGISLPFKGASCTQMDFVLPMASEEKAADMNAFGQFYHAEMAERCTSCHASSDSNGNLGLGTQRRAFANLVEVDADTRDGLRVAPGSISGSVLWQMLAVERVMPQSGEKFSGPDDPALAPLKRWIEEGAEGPQIGNYSEEFLAERQRLSELGLYSGGSTSVLAANAIEFDPRFPLFTDNEEKRRWVVLPPGTEVDTSDMEHWELPVGGKLFKEFAQGGTKIETRLIERTGPGPNDYFMAAYVWDKAQTDATLALDGKESALVEVHGIDAPGRHDVPSESACMACHAGSPARTLGFSAIQLLGPGGDADELADILSDPPPADIVFDGPPAGMPVESWNLQNEALGALHGNCGHCHNGLGSAAAVGMKLQLDLLQEPGGRYFVTVDGVIDTILDVPVTQSSSLDSIRLSSDETNFIDGYNAEIVRRMDFLGGPPAGMMPPLGVTVQDTANIHKIIDWIESMQ